MFVLDYYSFDLLFTSFWEKPLSSKSWNPSCKVAFSNFKFLISNYKIGRSTQFLADNLPYNKILKLKKIAQIIEKFLISVIKKAFLKMSMLVVIGKLQSHLPQIT